MAILHHDEHAHSKLNGHSHVELTRPAYRYGGEFPPALEPLREQSQWVAWGYVSKGGKWTKPPFNPRTGRLASVSDPKSWGRFEEALAGIKKHGGLAGVGFVLTDQDGIIGIDLDDCISDSGSFSNLAAEIINYNETYAEISPSGEGIRILARGKIDKALKNDALGVEV
jgi:primase-polymerase (primpol)-like protein